MELLQVLPQTASGVFRDSLMNVASRVPLLNGPEPPGLPPFPSPEWFSDPANIGILVMGSFFAIVAGGLTYEFLRNPRR